MITGDPIVLTTSQLFSSDNPVALTGWLVLIPLLPLTFLSATVGLVAFEMSKLLFQRTAAKTLRQEVTP